MNLLVAGNSYIWPQRGDKLYICVSMHKVAGEREKKSLDAVTTLLRRPSLTSMNFHDCSIRFMLVWCWSTCWNMLLNQ